jgi:hypothetical protein
MSEQVPSKELSPCQVPLLEQLRSTPLNAHHWLGLPNGEARNIPYGPWCHSAADELERLQRAITTSMQRLSNGDVEGGARVLRECFWGTAHEPPAVPPGCKQCPWTVGDTYQRDCGYPDCSPGTAQPPDPEWQPIETAPKDGTTVLGWIPRLGYVARQDCVPMNWSGWGGGVWENTTSGHKLGTEPTHWMPLPPPPSTQETPVAHCCHEWKVISGTLSTAGYHYVDRCTKCGEQRERNAPLEIGDTTFLEQG